MSDEKQDVDQSQTTAASTDATADCEQAPDSAAGAAEPKREKFPKHMFALLFSYNGDKYRGLQINPGVPTIEETLARALAKAGFMEPYDWDTEGIKLGRYKWSRTARTDARVHALCQVVACKLYYKAELFQLSSPEKAEAGAAKASANHHAEHNAYKDARASVPMAKCINKELPADIRVVNVFKVSKSFDGRKHCDKRTYDYLLPVRLLIPTEGAPRHFSKTLEPEDISLDGWCTDQFANIGRKEGFLRSEFHRHCYCHRRAGGPPAPHEQPWGFYLTGRKPSDVTLPEAVLLSVRARAEARREEETSSKSEVLQQAAAVESAALAEHKARLTKRTTPPQDEAAALQHHLKLFRACLKKFEGTHSFHNFTTGMTFGAAQASRFILSYDVSEPITIAGEPYVVATVTGQSFVLNQIRRMIGLAVWVAREWLPLQMVDVALSPLQLVVPRIPGAGLILRTVFFDGYNAKLASTHEPLEFAEDKLEPEARKLQAEFREELWEAVAEQIASSKCLDEWIEKAVNDQPTSRAGRALSKASGLYAYVPARQATWQQKFAEYRLQELEDKMFPNGRPTRKGTKSSKRKFGSVSKKVLSNSRRTYDGQPAQKKNKNKKQWGRGRGGGKGKRGRNNGSGRR